MGVDVHEGRGRPTAASMVLVIDPAIARPGIPVLCARLTDLPALRRAKVGVVICEVCGVAEPGLVVVEALARLRLAARRLGYDLRVRGPHPRLRQLLVLTGLDGIVPIEDGSASEPHGQPEQWEQPLDVQEVGDRRDAAG
jgi:hypothetical protein